MSEISSVLKDQEKLDALAKTMEGEFSQAEQDRRSKELEWIENLRQVKGIYDPEILANFEEGESRVYPRYTRSKEVPAIAKLNSILLPAHGENWDIMTTANPELPKEDLDAISETFRAKVMEAAKKGEAYVPTQEEIDLEIADLAEQKKEGMKATIQDQLTEMLYRDIVKKVIKSGIRFGTGIWKGPLSKKHVNKKYTYEDGQVYAKNEERFVPDIGYVPLWRFYPDMSTSEINETSFIFQEHCLNIGDMESLKESPGFKKDIIEQIMKENPQGNYKLKQWEQEILNIDENTKSKEKGDKSTPSVKGFEMLERWGLVDGKYLIQAGIDVDEVEEGTMYETVAFIIAGRMVKFVRSPLNDITVTSRPFNAFYYDKDETSIFGEGLPRTIRGTAISIGAASRMILNNGAITAGPQLEVNLDLLDENQDVSSIHSGKIWYREGRGVEAQYPAIRDIQFNSHIAEYQSIINMFKDFGDEESALPSFLFAEPDKTNMETATGMDTRQTNMNVTLNDIVKNFDEPNESFIRAMYKWNLEFNDNEEIKGDYDIKSLGSSSIMNKETQNLLLTQFAGTLTEEERMYLKTSTYLKERAKLMDLDADRLLKTDAQVQKEIKERQNPELEKLKIENLKADIQYTKSKAAHMLSKSKSEVEKGKNQSMENQEKLSGVDVNEEQ